MQRLKIVHMIDHIRQLFLILHELFVRLLLAVNHMDVGFHDVFFEWVFFRSTADQNITWSIPQVILVESLICRLFSIFFFTFDWLKRDIELILLLLVFAHLLHPHESLHIFPLLLLPLYFQLLNLNVHIFEELFLVFLFRLFLLVFIPLFIFKYVDGLHGLIL